MVDFLTQILILLVFTLTYFGGGFIASMALEELKAAKKYLVWLITLLVPTTLGILLLEWLSVLAAVGIALIVLILLATILREKNIFIIEIVVAGGAILSGNLYAILSAGLIILLQGILNYSSFHKSKKIKNIFFIRGLILFGGILAVLLLELIILNI